MIHERIASRMSYELAESAVIPEPTDAQLRAWFDAHAERYTAPERIDFTHVFVASADSKRADELAAQLAAGTAPETLGDTFSGGRKYRGRKLADLTEAFGATFVDGLATQPPNTWVRRMSRHGLHLVRVDKLEAAKHADFATARLEIRREWLEEQRRIAAEAALVQLRAHWQVERR
jgi:peptidyl-prolyl cis-trans isomerase C